MHDACQHHCRTGCWFTSCHILQADFDMLVHDPSEQYTPMHCKNTPAGAARQSPCQIIRCCTAGDGRQEWLCLIGTYQPAVELWRLSAEASAMSSAAASFQLLGRVDVGDTAPLKGQMSDPLGLGTTLQSSHHVPESVQLLPQTPGDPAQVTLPVCNPQITGLLCN